MKDEAVGNRQQAVVNTAPIRGYRDLTVWQKSFTLAVETYRFTRTFPESERFGLTSQMCRAGFSIPANIAEGYRRRGKDYIRFLRTVFGSASELETYLLISQELQLGHDTHRSRLIEEIQGVLKMLSALIEKLR